MGYGLMPYRINISKIEGLYGTQNTELKTNIIQACSSEFNRLDEDFETEDGWLESRTIMEAFLNGALEKIEYNSAKHWYIVELLIRGFGQDLDNGSWYPANIDPLYGLSEFRMYLIEKQGKINLKSPDDFPVVFTIENGNLDEALNSIKTNYSDSGQVNEFVSWVREAKDQDQDLVLYYY